MLLDSSRVLLASADTVIPLLAADSTTIRAARSVVTASDPRVTYAGLLQDAIALDAAIGEDAARDRLSKSAAFAFDPLTDSAALRRVDQALGGSSFGTDPQLTRSALARLGAGVTVGGGGRVLTARQIAQAGAAMPITVLYINGIQTSSEDNRNTVAEIIRLVREAGLPDYSPSVYRVVPHYNATAAERRGEGAFCVVAAVAATAYADDDPSVFKRVLDGCGFGLDIARATEQVMSLLNWNATSVGKGDADQVVAQVQQERARGHGVIILGHSQGTLIAQMALRTLYGVPQDLGSEAARCTGYISLAGPQPDQVAVLHKANFYVQGVHTRDIILSQAALAGSSGFTGIETDLAEQYDQDLIGNLWSAAPYARRLDFRDLAFGLKLHSIVPSYLRAMPMRAAIQQSLRQQVDAIRRDCARAVPTALAVTVQPGAVRSGEALNPQPVVEVRDANGTRVPGATLTVTARVAGGSAVLHGTTAVVADDGTARFTDLTVQGSGSVQLGFDATGVASAASTVFEIQAAAVPSIGLAPATVPLTAVIGSSAPSARVNVANAGQGTLDQLSLGATAYGPGEPAGWLTARLASTGAPTSITLDASAAGLAPGSYTATVPVRSGAANVANSPQSVTVKFTVTRAPAIALDRTAVQFSGVAGQQVAFQVVNVTNGGPGTLTGLATGAPAYTGTPSGWLTASIDGTTAPATVSLSVNTAGLGAGNYAAAVPVTSTLPGVAGARIDVGLTLAAAGVPRITLNPNSATFAATAGGPDPAVQSIIQVTNTGTGGTLSGLAVGTITYGTGASGWLRGSLSSANAPATLTLAATSGSLAAGTYTAMVPITSAATGVVNSPQSVNVSLVVSPAPPTITGFSPPAPQATRGDQPLTIQGTGFQPGLTVTVTFPNGGNGLLSGAQIGTVGATSVPVLIDFNGVAGTYTLRVNNPGGQSSNAAALTVSAAAPVLRVDGGASSTRAVGQTFTTTGTGFSPGGR